MPIRFSRLSDITPVPAGCLGPKYNEFGSPVLLLKTFLKTVHRIQAVIVKEL